MHRLLSFEQFSPRQSRFRQVAACCLRGIWSRKHSSGMQQVPVNRPVLPFIFTAIPRSRETLVSALKELSASYRPLHLCLPDGTSYHQKLAVIRWVYELCAETNIEDVSFLLYEPLTTAGVPLPRDPKGKDAIILTNFPIERCDKAVLGGTFDRLHYGHKLLLAEAAMLTKVTLTVGITTSNFNQSKDLTELIEPWDIRANNITRFLSQCLPCLMVRCKPLDDIYGPALEPDQKLLVVTEETAGNVELVQKRRQNLGLPEIEVYTVPLLRGSDGREGKISSSQHRKEIIGKLIKPPKLRDLRSYVIGLTGRTCSGKSSVARILKGFGAYIIDCDVLAHETYRPTTSLYNALVETFGEQILEPKRSPRPPPIDRSVLGAIVFGDKKKMSTLCSMVWPELKEKVKDVLRRTGSKIVVLDAAVLIQAGFLEFVDEVWVCAVDRWSCIQRLMHSRRLLYSEAVKRLDAHLSDEDYVREANILISTRGTEAQTAEIVTKCWKDLIARLQSRKHVDWALEETDPLGYFDEDSFGREGDDEAGDTSEDDSGKW